MPGKIPVESACRNVFPFVTLPGRSASAVFYLEDTWQSCPLQNTVYAALLLTLEYLVGIAANAGFTATTTTTTTTTSTSTSTALVLVSVLVLVLVLAYLLTGTFFILWFSHPAPPSPTQPHPALGGLGCGVKPPLPPPSLGNL